MAQDLNKAAEQGKLDALYEAIERDPFILDKMDSVPFMDTPLHHAASAGQSHFAIEMVTMMKPSLARKLNQCCYTPVHLAVMNGHEDLVRRLLSKDRGLIHVHGKDGKTPLHCMITSLQHWYRNPSFLGEVVAEFPDSVKDLTATRETALHLIVKCNHQYYDAFQLFQVMMKHIREFRMEEIYAWRDEKGNTPLHLAIHNQQYKMIDMLFVTYESRIRVLEIDAKDATGRTVPELINGLCNQDGENSDLLKLKTHLHKNAKVKWLWDLWWLVTTVTRIDVSADTRDTLLVVLALLVAAFFQIGINPPGGLWQDSGTHNGKQYQPGTPILATTNPLIYQIIAFYTNVGLVGSLNLVMILAGRTTWGLPLVVPLSFYFCSYTFSQIAISRNLGLVKLTMIYILAYIFVHTFTTFVMMRPAKPRKLPFELGNGHPWRREILEDIHEMREVIASI